MWPNRDPYGYSYGRWDERLGGFILLLIGIGLGARFLGQLMEPLLPLLVALLILVLAFGWFFDRRRW